MRLIFSFLVLFVLMAFSYVGVEFLHLHFLFGVIIPYSAALFFVTGFIYRIIQWSKSPVPFNITTTAGQQKSLSWIKSNNFNNPHNAWGVAGRLFLEVFFFRSLFRNTKAYLNKQRNLGYASEKTLWLFGILFHYSFLYVFIRHLRFFTNPLPGFLNTMDAMDSFMQIGLPAFYITDLILIVSVTFLFLRRVVLPQIKYISLASDYFPLLLILAIAVTGVLMRYEIRQDIIMIKTFTLSLLHFAPVISEEIGVMFFIHLFLVSVLFLYFPLSKLMHMGGIFLSPTRNLKGNSRMRRHVNPWNYPVKVHPYEEYEDEFREAMIGAGIPVEKQSETKGGNDV